MHAIPNYVYGSPEMTNKSYSVVNSHRFKQTLENKINSNISTSSRPQRETIFNRESVS